MSPLKILRMTFFVFDRLCFFCFFLVELALSDGPLAAGSPLTAQGELFSLKRNKNFIVFLLKYLLKIIASVKTKQDQDATSDSEICSPPISNQIGTLLIFKQLNAISSVSE